MGTGKGTVAEPLPSATVLKAQLDAANEMQRRLTAVLAAVLIENHRGRLLLRSEAVDSAYGDAAQANGFMVDVMTLAPLGKHRLQVMTPDGSTYVPAPVVIEAETAESLICSDASHKRGSGLRCEECGKLLEKRA
jgi:hypothetical protein